MHHRVVLYIWLLTFIALILPTHTAAATVHSRQQRIAVLPSISATFPSFITEQLTVQQLTVQQQRVPDRHPHNQRIPEEGPMGFLSVVTAAELVVHGRVMRVDVAWDGTGRTIKSTAMIAVRETLVGKTLVGSGNSVVTVETPGGFLATEGIGMVSVHAAHFTEGEELLLFLSRAGESWQTVQGAAGKVLIQGEAAINPDQQWRATLHELQSLVRTVAARGTGTPGSATSYPDSHTDLAHGVHDIMQTTALSTAFDPLQQVWSSTGAMVTRKWPAPNPSATFYVNVNSTQVTTEGLSEVALRSAIVGAANQWSSVNSADFLLRSGGPTSATTTGYNGMNEIVFMGKGQNARAAAAEVWYRSDMTIVEADIWINDDYNWNVSDTPDADTVDLESAVLHEFGHWLILGHLTEQTSVMYPKLATGAVKRSLQTADIAGISAIYPR